MLGVMKLARIRARLRRRSALHRKLENEPTLRSELYSADQMERHGRTLAGLHRLSKRQSANLLLSRLTDNESVLSHA